MPRRGPAGLAVPSFGPRAQTSVLMPDWATAMDVTPEQVMASLVPGLGAPPPEAGSHSGSHSGRRKPPKRLRLPGASAPAAVTGVRIIPGDDGHSATLHARGRTLTGRGDGAADMAEALLSHGILRDSDWQGGLERTLRRCLTRWANDDKGASAWRFLGDPLALVYTDDAPAYSAGVVLSRWLDLMRLPAGRPVGFFGLRYQSPPRPVHVRRAVTAVERAHPGVGYGLLGLLDMTFVSSVAGYGFRWGRQVAGQWEALDGGGLWEGNGPGSGYNFDEHVPLAACATPFRLGALDGAIKAESCATASEILPVLSAARGLFDACRRAGKRFHSTNHCPYLSWAMSVGERNRGAVRQHLIPSLERAPVVYTVWEPQDDPMTRLVDDYCEMARSTMQYTDLTWMHCWQAGFAGREPDGAARHMQAHERKVRKVARRSPQDLAFLDPDYVPGPMPDGSLRDACEALSLCLDVLGTLDRLLTLMHTPETLAEQIRMEGH